MTSSAINRAKLSYWYHTTLGEELAKVEHQHLSEILAALPGNQLLQLGYDKSGWLTASRIMYKCILEQQSFYAAHASVIADYSELPFTNELFDVVVLPHVLDCADNYPIILREAARVMSGEGYLIILGFNPYSLAVLSPAKPPIHSMPSLAKLRYWLKQANCEIERVNRFFYRPFIQHEKVLKKLAPMETVGTFCWPGQGACYVLIARKKVLAITPLSQKIKNGWRNLIAKPVIEPSRSIR